MLYTYNNCSTGREFMRTASAKPNELHIIFFFKTIFFIIGNRVSAPILSQTPVKKMYVQRNSYDDIIILYIEYYIKTVVSIDFKENEKMKNRVGSFFVGVVVDLITKLLLL